MLPPLRYGLKVNAHASDASRVWLPQAAAGLQFSMRLAGLKPGGYPKTLRQLSSCTGNRGGD